MSVKLSNELVSFIRPSDHSRFSPSSTDRWVGCPFSVKASDKIPDETSKYAAEGTLAHTVAEDYFAHMFHGAEKSPELMMADQDMMDGAQMHYDCIVGWLDHKDYIGEVLWHGLEKGIPIFPEKSCFGTADCVIVGTKGCVIIDYKYGKRSVSANSAQLKGYLLGIFRHLIDVPEDYQFHAVVTQPRTDTIPKVAEHSYYEMREFEAMVYTAILQADAPGLQPVEGSHCFWCKARRTNDPNLKCPAIAQKALKLAGENFDGFLADMNQPVKTGALNTKRDKALLKIMSLLPMMKQIAKDGEEEFKYRLEQGETIDGVNLVEVQGKRKWKLDDPRDMAREIAKLYPEVQAGYMTVPVMKVMSQAKVKKAAGVKDLDQSLTVRPLKKEIVIPDRTKQEVLGALTDYGKMIGLNLEQDT
ncbi:MAG: hypothetical protein Unbinned1322contig1000_30 [Prokaryotic dsDNA virus sp.]|nr:hypothetical protein [Aequorivita sp.]QDP57286.1 MAG: hypothetical protein Unbinned1322contig1000_30 [Prokaryotic dsDNA virus sp.]|tara:strand:+ start:12135 stop:13382 length:1248 start_codon:yes stop_codon:yes gene_type:complete